MDQQIQRCVRGGKLGNFDNEQYKRVMAACKERDKFPTQAWIPDEEESSEEFMEDVYEKELGDSLEEVDDGVAVGLVDFTQDSEYIRLYGTENKTTSS